MSTKLYYFLSSKLSETFTPIWVNKGIYLVVPLDRDDFVQTWWKMKTSPRFNPTPENNLVAKALQGDLHAFNRLVLAYQDLAYHHALALLGQPAPAGEAVQRGMLSAYQNLSAFRGASFRAWLLSHVTRAAEAPDLRKGSRTPVVHPINAAENLEQDLARMPAQYRGAVTLVDVYQFDYAEAALALRIPPKTLLERLTLARRQIQAGLRAGEYEHGYRGPPEMSKDCDPTWFAGVCSS